MKAVQINRYGGNEVLEFNEKAPVPVLSKSQILVEVLSASINPVDLAIRSGAFKEKTIIQFPATLGGDFSGIVLSADSDFKKGDEVFGNGGVLNGGSGSFAGLIAVNIANVALKPKKINYAEAASLPFAGLSAYQALEKYIKASNGKKIFINGGAGGAGSLAIQLAKNYDAYVAAAVNKKNIDFVKALGADLVIDFQQENFDSLSEQFDAVLDTVGGDFPNKLCRILKKGGILVSLKEKPDRDIVDKYEIVAVNQVTNTNTLQLKKLAGLVDNGIIKIQIDKVYPLPQIKDAFKYYEETHPQGKVVLKVKGELIGKINEVLLGRINARAASKGKVQILPGWH